MKTLIITAFILLLGNISYSQTTFTFTYDASGNRTKRVLPPSPQGMPVIPVLEDSIKVADMVLSANNQEETNTNEAFAENTGDAFLVILYPNPTYGQFTLELPDFKSGEKGYIIVYDQMGKAVINQKYISLSQYFDISGVMPGYYIIHIMVNDKLVIKKIIKQ